MAGSLATRVALVPGASSGIGEATAVALAAAGAVVIAVARRQDRLEQCIARIEADGGRALALAGDVTDGKGANCVVAAALERFGRLDILVNSAGIMQAANVEQADAVQWRRMLEVNLLA